MKKILILLIIAGISYFVYLNNTGITALKTFGNQNGESNSDNIYTNTKFNYQITVPKGWRVSELVSKKMEEFIFSEDNLEFYYCGSKGVSPEGGDTHSIDKDCVKNNPDLSRNILQNQKYLNEWNIENAQYVFITRLSQQEESKFLVDEYFLDNYNLPVGSVMTIHAFNSSNSNEIKPLSLTTAILSNEKTSVGEIINTLRVSTNTTKESKETEDISRSIRTFKILK
jgi:hypothetical protein